MHVGVFRRIRHVFIEDFRLVLFCKGGGIEDVLHIGADFFRVDTTTVCLSFAGGGCELQNALGDGELTPYLQKPGLSVICRVEAVKRESYGLVEECWQTPRSVASDGISPADTGSVRPERPGPKQT